MLRVFDAIQRPDGLMQALDQINARHGRGKARLGLAGQDARWLMRQENLSPSYTTRWSDIPEASMGATLPMVNAAGDLGLLEAKYPP